MSDDERDDDDAATMIGKTDVVREAMARPGVESPTRRFDLGSTSGPTKAMPSGYGLEHIEREALRASAPSMQQAMVRGTPSQSSGLRQGGQRFVPSARPSAPRPAAGRPAVPSLVDDPSSASEMTLIEAIDAELESITAELSIPEGSDPHMLEDAVSSSEMTIRMAVPDDLPSNLLDATSEPGTMIQPPRETASLSIQEMRGAPQPPLSLSSMPTPPRQVRTLPMPPADPTLSSAPPTPGMETPPLGTSEVVGARGPTIAAHAAGPAPDLASAERPIGPAPAWVGRYLAACVVVSIVGALLLAYLRAQRFW